MIIIFLAFWIIFTRQQDQFDRQEKTLSHRCNFIFLLKAALLYFGATVLYRYEFYVHYKYTSGQISASVLSWCMRFTVAAFGSHKTSHILLMGLSHIEGLIPLSPHTGGVWVCSLSRDIRLISPLKLASPSSLPLHLSPATPPIQILIMSLSLKLEFIYLVFLDKPGSS